MYKILLAGCRPEPLADYLKALGILRLLSKIDPQCKGYWENESFVLLTKQTEEKILEFFLHEYQPSPFASPWNGSTGFYAKDAQKNLLESIQHADTKRFGQYHEAIEIAAAVVGKLQLKEQPKDSKIKKQLLSQLRNEVPNTMSQWIDTCVMITGDDDSSLKFAPLMGTGGNDGNFEFGRTFMQQLQNLIDLNTGVPTADASKLLRSTLFDTSLPQQPYSGKIGQFNPMAAGGANSTTGTDGDSRVNPWDFVLMVEGMLVFMPGITRRGEMGNGGAAAPFTAMRASAAGYGSAANEKVRAELWVPLWNRPVGLGELLTLFREGRAKVNTGGDQLRYRTARSGVDFVRAVANLGVARGIKAFHRYGFQERNGLSYFAVSLGRFATPQRPRRDLLRDLDVWLSKFSAFAAASGEAPAGVKRSLRFLEETIVNQAQGRGTLLELLIALGEAEKALNQSLHFAIDKISPIPYLRSSRWLVEANDGSPEFRLALSLARSGLRPRLVRVRGHRPAWEKEDDKVTTWGFGSLVDNLSTLGLRNEIEWEQSEKKALSTPREDVDEQDSDLSKVELAQKAAQRELKLLPTFLDIEAWLRDDLDDDRLEAIARGLSLLKFSRAVGTQSLPAPSTIGQAFLEEQDLLAPVVATNTTEKNHQLLTHQESQAAQGLPLAYQLIKVVQHRKIGPDSELPRVPGLLGKLGADRPTEAIADAARRLRASNLRPLIDPHAPEAWWDEELDARRLGAALAFPITDHQATILLNRICINNH